MACIAAILLARCDKHPPSTMMWLLLSVAVLVQHCLLVTEGRSWYVLHSNVRHFLVSILFQWSGMQQGGNASAIKFLPWLWQHQLPAYSCLRQLLFLTQLLPQILSQPLLQFQLHAIFARIYRWAYKQASSLKKADLREQFWHIRREEEGFLWCLRLQSTGMWDQCTLQESLKPGSRHPPMSLGLTHSFPSNKLQMACSAVLSFSFIDVGEGSPRTHFSYFFFSAGPRSLVNVSLWYSPACACPSGLALWPSSPRAVWLVPAHSALLCVVPQDRPWVPQKQPPAHVCVCPYSMF